MTTDILNISASLAFSLRINPLGETLTTLTIESPPVEDGFLNEGTILQSLFATNVGDYTFINAETGVIGTSVSAPIRFETNGDSTVTLDNAGAIYGDVQLGNGDDIVDISGLVTGDIRTNAGDDLITISGSVNGDLLTASGNDTVFLTGEVGRVNLGDGNDRFSAVADGNFSSTDYAVGRVIGGKGADLLLGGGNDDRLEGGNGRDILRGHDGDDTLLGGQGADLLAGGDGNDLLVGGAGADRMFGGNGDDVLLGSLGKDVLTGGRGDDMLTGGSGADVFRFQGQSGSDTITDFDAQDVVDLDLPDVFVPPVLPEIDVPVAVALAETIIVSSFYDLMTPFLSEDATGVTLDLDGFFTSIGEVGRTGGGTGQVNEIFFEGLVLTDLTADNFIF